MRTWESIPGETPIADISGLKIPGVATRATLSAAEARNIRAALIKYVGAKPTRRSAPFDARWFLKLHKEMFGKVWSWAGTLRTTELNIGIPARQDEVALHDLSADLSLWESDATMPLLDQSAILHHRAVAIHPFLNGNGRWARLLANIWLRRHDHPLTMWPEETVGHESIIRGEYLAAIKTADAGDLTALCRLHSRFSA